MAETTKGELERLLILAYTKPDYSGKATAEFRVAFNPTEYTQVYDVEYKRQQGEGTTGSPVIFRKIKPQEYKLKFLLDGTGVTGEKRDVHETVREFFKVVGYDGAIHRPRFLKLIWGKLESRCVLLKADIIYKMFRPDGSPLRALLDCTFTENIDDKSRAAKAKDSSPDLTHVRTVQAGDTLPLLTYEIYGDHRYYLEVARANELDDFRDLKPGTRILFPPLAKESHGQ